MLVFITGNKTKFQEASRVLIPLEMQQVNIDLAEIQELDPHVIIRHKLLEAFKHQSGEFIVEDSSLYMDALAGKLPGPLVKWFNDSIGTEGLADIAEKLGNGKARAKTIVGYAKSPEEVLFFEGNMEGNIVRPRGEYLFGYDPIFVPAGQSETLAELKAQGNFSFSPRGLAMKKLKEHLLSNN